jgi:hypothetical protein
MSEINKVKIVAILDMSSGNESVGEMWSETKVVDSDTPIKDILRWAVDKTYSNGAENFKGNLRITVGQ